MERLRELIQQYLHPDRPGDAPARQLWEEALGFFILFLGVFLAFALVGRGDNAENLVGPIGENLSQALIYSLGVISYLWPPGLIIWGILLVTGIIRKPRKRRFVFFILVSISMAAMAQTLYPNSTMVFGQGGKIGWALGVGATAVIGKIGATLFYALTTILSLIFTRNMTFTVKRVPGKRAKVDDIEAVMDEVAAENEKAMKAGERARKRKAKQEEEAEEQVAQGATKELGVKLELGPNLRAPAKPDTKIFKTKSIRVSDSPEDAKIAEELTGKLEEFKVMGQVTGVTQGPVVKTYEFEPSAGTKVSKIEALQPDLARLLMTDSLRVVPVPGSSTVGFEIPNPDRQVIPFGNLINDPAFKSKSMALPITMGVDTFGNPVIEDLAEMPHILVAGSTGSGKSVFVNTLITSLLVRNSARDLRMILIDPKMVELGMFNNTAHQACEVVTNIEKDGLPILQSLVNQMERRYKYLNQIGAKNITAFNDIIKNEKKNKYKSYKGKWQTMPYIVVIVDEFADMIMALGKEAETAIARLAQKARAAGIHLVIATQRPSVQVVTGTIKANFPTRVGFRVTSGVDSRTILDQSGAESLLGKGDMLYMSATGLKRLHAAFITEEELKRVAKACKKK